jgi:hypothetical protein
MKIKLLSSLALACSLSYGAIAQNTFTYGFQDVYSSNALEYIVGENNIQRTQEPITANTDVSYWNPINNGQTSSLTFEFTFAQPTTSISLYATLASFNFGDGEFGSGSLWASTDGENWTLLMDAPTPAYPGYEYGLGYTFDANLPTPLIGATDIWIQAQLDTSGWDILSQFSRQDTAANNGTGYNNGGNIFELDATLAPVPEPSSAMLAVVGVVLLLAFRKVKNTTRSILSALVIAFFISCGNLHADSDQDIQRAAQQLKDTDDAQKAEAQREDDSKHPQGDGGLMAGVFVLLLASVPMVYILSKTSKMK